MTVYFTYTLSSRFPHIAHTIAKHLNQAGIQYLETNIGNNPWIRDFMPIKTVNGFTKFQYDLPKKWPALAVPKQLWASFNPDISGIKLDGGNVEQNKSTVLMTEMVFKRNVLSRKKLTKALEETFGKKIIFLPVEPGDDLGHIDGIARFLDDHRVIINDYSSMKQKQFDKYQERIEKILTAHGFETILFPYAYNQRPRLTEKEARIKYPFLDAWNPAFGYYINFYKAGSLIFLPTFYLHGPDVEKIFPDSTIVPINCADLSMTGGLLNCVTWED